MRSETLLDELDANIGIGSSFAGNEQRESRRLSIPGLSTEDIATLRLAGNPVAALASETTSKSYRTLHKCRDATSHSILSSLHSCPRKMLQEKLSANQPDAAVRESIFPNIDFVFGHSVGAGIQAYLAFDQNLPYALYATFVSWRFNFDLGREDYNTRKKKSIERAVIAVEMFASWWSANMESEWELVYLSDGRPAVELSFCIDFGKIKYFGHIDLLLRNKRTGKIAVGENKTTGFSNVHEAAYKNSGQALGYSVALDAIFGEETDYDVLYYAYSAPGEEWHFFPFAKTAAMKMEWIQDRLIDAGHLQQYFELKHFPKNGGSCLQFNRPCSFFGTCDLVDKAAVDKLPRTEELREEVGEEYPVDFFLRLEDVVGRQTKGMVEES